METEASLVLSAQFVVIKDLLVRLKPSLGHCLTFPWTLPDLPRGYVHPLLYCHPLRTFNLTSAQKASHCL